MNQLERGPALNYEVWDSHGPDLRSARRAT
jgi:hypothetical protein